MASINTQELNNFIHNFQETVGVNELKIGKADAVSEFLIDNLSNIGRYAYRDFERFGNRISDEGDDDHFDRQDGWVSLTEEVPSIDHLTYGTGILYIHGEMEIPEYEDDAGDNIFGDEFYHVDKNGDTKHIYEDVVNPERFKDWGNSEADTKGTYTPALRLAEFGSLLEDDPDYVAPPPVPGVPTPPTPQTATGPELGDQGVVWGYVHEFRQETHTGTIGDGRWLYETVTDAVGGEFLDEYTAKEPETNEEDPPIHNDDEIYNLDNERNHYPYVVINSARPASIKTFLEEWEGKNGMYDEELPTLAKDTYPPKKHEGIKYVKGGIDAILDFISPLEETP